MKKIYIILCAAIAALALAGCQKENDTVQGMDARTHTIVFTAEKMIDTRTAIASEGDGVVDHMVSYKWIAGDDERMEILEFYEVEVEKDGQTKIETRTNKGTITGMTLSNNDKSATFTAEFSGDVPADLIGYRAAYAGSFATTSHNPKIPAAQNPLPNTFDPAADVLVSDLFQNGRETSSFVFDLTRKVSVNKMTLKGLTPGEVISTVTFESDKQHAATYVLNTSNYSGEGKKLTFTYTSNNTVPTSGEFPVYFTTAPVENATFTVSVTTDQNKYRKTSTKTISFATGEVRRFGVNLSGCEVPDGRTFTLVENVNDLVIGSDVVIAADGSKNIAMSQTQETNNRGVTDATKSADGKTIEINDQTVQIFTLSAGTQAETYAFLCSNGSTAEHYLYAASSTKNYLRSQPELDDNASWKIIISNKEATITAQGTNANNIIRYNSGSNIFSCYASGQQPVYLYQAAGLPAADLSFTDPSYTFTLGDTDYTNFTGQALNNPNSISDITWTSSNPDLATVDSDGVITWVADATGTATITASFAGDNFFAAGNASYTITVKAAATVLTLPFLETFANCNGTMGWSGSGIANGEFKPDHEDWSVANASGANGAAKFGTGSSLGSAETPMIDYSGDATLTFKAGAWNGGSESTTLKLSLSSGFLYGDASLSIPISSVTLAKGAWAEYTVYLKNLESPFTVTFEGNDNSNSRFFLDDVSIVEGIDTSVETVADPTFSPAGGTYTAAQNVTLSCTSTGASIYYTTDGSVPTASSTLYSSPISVSETMTIKAIAIKDGTSSNVATATYTINLPTVDYVTLDWTFPGGTKDDLATIAGVTTFGLGDDYGTGNAPYRIKFDTTGDYIMVKTDKSIGDVSVDYKMIGGASTSSIKFSESSDGESWNDVQTLSISGSLNDTGTLTTTSSFNSASRYVKMTFTKGSNVGIGGIRIRHEKPATTTVATPTFSPNGGTFTSAQNVTISCATSGATIHYTTDNSTPTASSATYSGAISVTATTTIKAIAVKDNVSSSVAEAVFTINSSTTYSSPVSFTTSDFNGQGTSGSGSNLSVEKAPITVSSNKGYCNGTEHIRIYQNGTLTISANGKTITRIEITSTNKATENYGPGKISRPSNQGGSYSTSGYKGIWTGNAASITFNASAQFRFTDIVVTYK